MLNESLTYLQRDDNWVKTVLIGGVLSLLSFLFIPIVLVTGYYVRVLRATMHGEERPPVFDDWGDLAIDGVKAAVIGFVYFLVPSIVGGVVGAIGGFSFLGGAAGDSGAMALAGGLIFLVGGVIALVLGLAVSYVLPAALANFVEEDSLGAAFSFGTIRSVITTGQYATAWVYGFAIVLGVGILIGVLNVVPLIGGLVGLFVSFYGFVAAYYIIGSTWGEMHELSVVDEGAARDESAAI